MSDLIERQAAIKAIENLQDCYNGFSDTYDKACIIGVLEEVPSAQPAHLEMTEQELVAEAKRSGYVIFKKKEWVPLLKCPICGKKPLEWGDAFNVHYECQNGCMAGGKGNRRQARVLWNKAVEEYEG